ncbi:PBSX family phage terminase large subunit [Pseudoflavonifractor sp. 524-17]|uniref:PBSX family phage terminase large subunit n=1 Tax=Pseudoflavonifractor sp. 524-17 TaxID=2304577 RepID=UPI00137B0C84|nr:PBSX family phage terminase large subunit [Pseudoflavonifractor sp. 524-17]NCE64686.1 PBSX family phage terminase large subunit [Pseudoflavonifractor sp. 524-17]
MKFKSFSPKQRTVLTWWCGRSPWRDREAIICDGAVRSGKTLCMGLSFFCWAMGRFREEQFALCGKSVGALRRNLLREVLPALRQLGFQCEEKVSRNVIEVRRGRRHNTFYLFGGRDEGSAGLIQGVTLAGVLLDEVALMPRSFVEQALARCSVQGAKSWFSCNPAGPEHWFYREWIEKSEERRALYLHFTMEDNPSLSRQVRERYARTYSGTFYRRFVLGEWTAAQGAVYDFFDSSYVKPVPQGPMERWCVSCDYGTRNPASFGLWGLREGVWYRVKEYYYDAGKTGRQKTDGEYAQDLARLAGERSVDTVVVDPSAASFIEILRREGWNVVKADNQVLRGIRRTAELLQTGRLVICQGCGDAIREFSLYCWDERAGDDQVRKEHDHAMDDIRYFAATIAGREEETEFEALCVERQVF